MSPILITLHALAASVVILLAPVQILRRTKDRAHRWIGRSWVISIWIVCATGMFIYTLTGGFTIFHALAIFTFFTTTLGVIQIRRGRVRSHMMNMIGSWIGALVAGGFAVLVPDREIPKLAVSDPVLLWSLAGAITVATGIWVIVVLRYVPRLDAVTPVATPRGA